MRVNVPAAGGKPFRVASFKCPTFVIFQVTAPNTMRVGSSDVELQQTQDQGIQDGLQLNQANTTPPLGLWWNGDLWVISNTAQSFPAIIEMPGAANVILGSGVAGVGV